MRDTELLTMESAGEDFSRVRRGRLNESQVGWIEEQLQDVREGALDTDTFLYRIRHRDFAGTVPFSREAMTVSDFPLMLINNVMDRTLLAGYLEAPAAWPSFARLKVNSDLRDASLFAVDGGEGVLTPINELGPYPEASLSETEYKVRVRKFGRKFGFSWETYIQDGLNAFQSIPARMGRAARRTEDYLMAQLIATDANIAALFTTANKNKVNILNGARTDNPAFSYEGVEDALQVLSNQLDADGQPIDITGAVVVYPSGMQATANRIQHMTQIRSTVKGGDASNLIYSGNALDGNVTWVPNHQLVIAGETNKKTGWFVFQNPNIGRPAVVAARLLGHENPELFMKGANAIQIGGGVVNPAEGNFDNDSIEYKVRMFFGKTQVDPKSVVYSNGTGA